MEDMRDRQYMTLPRAASTRLVDLEDPDNFERSLPHAECFKTISLEDNSLVSCLTLWQLASYSSALKSWEV